ncbi:hypothetical protein F2Q69_00029242 [Brassica cretica]|uniref:Uncharacterized protein n=1 Tax=Brassica cretica TaxID=69181 RepID=A0A8S9S739_BRACR|nr:hypothetical protein F2Q69_00029242 [Brassica cretica]
MKLNSVDTSKIDELPAKVDQLIVNNQNQVFIMEESTSEQNAKDAAPEIDKPAEDHQEPFEVDPYVHDSPAGPVPV